MCFRLGYPFVKRSSKLFGKSFERVLFKVGYVRSYCVFIRVEVDHNENQILWLFMVLLTLSLL